MISFLQRNWIYWFVSKMTWIYAKLFFRMRVNYQSGQKEILENTTRPIIITPNHTSYFDPPLISAIWPMPLHFFASIHLFENSSWFSWLLRKLYCHPVRRENGVGAVKEAIRLISTTKTSIVIFPEGTRSDTGAMQPLQEGAAFIAVKSEALLVPVYIDGVYEIWPRTRRLPRLFGKISINFGELIDPLEDAEGKSMKERVSQTHQKLEASFQKLSSQKCSS